MINRIKLINGQFVDLNNTQEMGFQDVNVVVRTITYIMHNALEEWANVKLDKKGTAYGIRRYSRGLVFSKFLPTAKSACISCFTTLFFTSTFSILGPQNSISYQVSYHYLLSRILKL